MTVDAVVVGGGIVGAATAFHLSRAGLRVSVVERAPAGGATGVSSGFVRVHQANPALLELARDGWREFVQWADVVGERTTFVRTGCVHAAAQGDPAHVAVMRDELGVPCEVLTAADLRLRFPTLCWPDGVGAVWEPEAGYASPGRCAAQYLQGVVRHGGSVSRATAVRVRTTRGRVSAVETTRGTIPSSVLVLAQGAWALRPLSGLPDAIAAIRVRRIVWQRLFMPRALAGLPLFVQDAPAELCFRADGPDHVIVSVGCDEWDVDPAEPPLAVDGPLLRLGRRRLAAVLGDTFLGSGREVIMGFDGYTPDGMPIVDRWPGADGAFVAAGFSGVGFKMAPGVGRALAIWVATGRRPAVLSNFGFRFESSAVGAR